MKVLLYSHCFYPSVGGIETVSLTLAEGLVQNKIDLKIITTTTSDKEKKQFPFEVIRNPSMKQRIALVKWADVILFNGASLALQPWILFFRKPFVWIHTAYQVSCIDGAGWVEGEQAPIQPYRSFIYHLKKKGWTEGIKEGIKLLIRRFFAKHIVSKNVAITNWMSQIQPLPRQVHIYNPFPLNQFLISQDVEPKYDFLYLGRIVSEKGVPTLLKAFSKVNDKMRRPITLLIIGDGNWRSKMEQLACDLEVSRLVFFAGKKIGRALVEFILQARIAVVPSEWYEPMGVAALELMASGKNLIVSEYGGLKECVGGAALCFPNGDHDALADCMVRLLENESLRREQLTKGKEILEDFRPSQFIRQYITLLNEVITN